MGFPEMTFKSVFEIPGAMSCTSYSETAKLLILFSFIHFFEYTEAYKCALKHILVTRQYL